MQTQLQQKIKKLKMSVEDKLKVKSRRNFWSLFRYCFQIQSLDVGWSKCRLWAALERASDWNSERSAFLARAREGKQSVQGSARRGHHCRDQPHSHSGIRNNCSVNMVWWWFKQDFYLFIFISKVTDKLKQVQSLLIKTHSRSVKDDKFTMLIKSFITSL